MTSRLPRWLVAAWEVWAEWTSKSGCLVRLIGRAGGAIRRPFFILGHVVEHVLSLVELRGLLLSRSGRPLVLAAGQQEYADDDLLHSGKVAPCPKTKKGPPRRTALGIALEVTLTCSRRPPERCRRRYRRCRRRCRQR